MSNLLLQAVLNAGFAAFIYICLQPGMIFHGYYRFILARLYFQIRKGSYINHRRRVKWKLALYKVLGGCVFCFGFWVSLFISLFRGFPFAESVLISANSVAFLYFFVFGIKE